MLANQYYGTNAHFKNFPSADRCIGISNTDLNDLGSTGFYMGDNLTNAPKNSSDSSIYDEGWWFIINLVYNASYIVQLAYFFTNNNTKVPLYKRHKYINTWHAWYSDY